ncbi:heme exporter protein B [Lactobacillus phage T280]|nr:heme exporter protein B [Lactobacillus phage T280]
MKFKVRCLVSPLILSGSRVECVRDLLPLLLLFI